MKFKNDKLIMIYKLNELEDKQLDVTLKFDKSIVKALDIKNKLLNRKLEYSSVLVSCDIFTKDEMETCLINK